MKQVYSVFLVLALAATSLWADEPIKWNRAKEITAPEQGAAPISPVKKAPVPVNPAPTAVTPAATTQASTPAQPAASDSATGEQWPQRFELAADERTGFGFVAGQPGPIKVTVQWQGAPLVVSLRRPGGDVMDRTGNGSVSIEYNATAEDVKKGVIWGVSLRPAQQTSQPSAGTVVYDKAVKQEVKPIATGNLSVQHPPADMQRAQAEINARAQQAKAAVPSAKPSAAPTSEVAVQKQAALQKQTLARQSAMLAQLKASAPGAVSTQSSAATAAPAETTLKKTPRITSPGANIKKSPGTQTAQTQSAEVGVAGAGQPATVANPTITSLSVAQGQPGDPVLITGSGFSDSPGEVHFVVAAGKDLVAPVTVWNNTQIFTEVPDISGVLAFGGQVYVRASNAASRAVPFQFKPGVECRTLGWTQDHVLTGPYDTFEVDTKGYVGYWFGFIFGGKGDDQYYRNTTLKNTWAVDSAYLVGGLGSSIGPWVTGNHAGDAYITEFRAGTASPYLKVHWWADAGSGVHYSPRVVICGPKGVAHQ